MSVRRVLGVSEQIAAIIVHRVEQLGECSPVDVWRSLSEERHNVMGRWSSEASARQAVRQALVDLVEDGRLVRVARGRYMSADEARRRY